MSNVGTAAHVKIGNDEFLCKFDTNDYMTRKYELPFVDRSSIALSRSEGDYGQYLVYTQDSWKQGEGSTSLDKDNEHRYRVSRDIDVSGAEGGLAPLKNVTSSDLPHAGTGHVVSSMTYNGPVYAYPAYTEVPNTTKYAMLYSSSSEYVISDVALGTDDLPIYDIVAVKGKIYIAFPDITGGGNGGIARWYTPWGAPLTFWDGLEPYAMCTDGASLYIATNVYNPSIEYWTTHFYVYPDPDASTTSIDSSVEIDGSTTCMANHSGTVYAIVNDSGKPGDSEVGCCVLYRYDGSNFTQYKKLPSGFFGMSLHSDGSVLYIGGNQKCTAGNSRGVIYYVTGSSGAESLGVVTIFGDRAVSMPTNHDHYVTSMVSYDNALYFPWMNYGGLGRYDTLNGGISRAYRPHNDNYVNQDDQVIQCLDVYGSSLYFVIQGKTDGLPARSNVMTVSLTDNKANSLAYGDITAPVASYLDMSYIDFGLPATQKLFTSVTIASPSKVALEHVPEMEDEADIALAYSVDGDTSVWTSLASSVRSETVDGDSSDGLRKYTFALPGSGDASGIKAHSLAVRIGLQAESINRLYYPIVNLVSTNGVTLVRAPGKIRPSKKFNFSLVLSRRWRELNAAMEQGTNSAKLANLRALLEAQTVTTFESYIEKGVIYNVLITKMSEITTNYDQNEGYEATVMLELLEI